MAITLTGSNGSLFYRLGKLGKLLYAVNGDQAVYATVFGEIAGQYESTLKDRYGALATRETALIRGQSGIVAAVKTLAEQTVIDTVEADQPAAARNLTDALNEVRRQMIATNNTVQSCSVGVTVTALGTPTGSGVIVYSTKRGDGLTLENMFAETGRMVCTADSYSGGLTEGRERFAYVGESGLGAGVFDHDWPAGTDANKSFTAVSADEDASSTGNLLTNGDFETWSGGTPTINGNAWVVVAGTAGTDFSRNNTSPFRGTYDLKLLAGTNTNCVFTQTFNDATGTTATLRPQTSYAVNLWAKASNAAVNTGVLTVDLIDGSNTVVTDSQGVNNSWTVNCAALNTTYTAQNGIFRTPAVLPDTLKLRLRVTTALTGDDVLVDDVAMTPLVNVYTGGPGLAVFSGATPFVKTDTWTVAQTNDRGSANYLGTFQALLDRFFDTRAKGLLFPSSGSPTIADSLITS